VVIVEIKKFLSGKYSKEKGEERGKNYENFLLGMINKLFL